MTQAILMSADATEAIFANTMLFQCCATGLVAAGADFRGADMRNADFSHATLDRANLDGVKLDRTDFHAISEQDAEFPSRQGALPPDPDRATADAWPQHADA
jgi:uncharacterized protein YjbI with pentapeptide repeats